MSSVSSAIGEKHTCQLCGYQTFKKTHLKQHAQAVHDGKQFNCPECEYKATRKSNLVSHHKSDLSLRQLCAQDVLSIFTNKRNKQNYR